ncbi:prephenate dehydrogenase/arogenate dehydrogenase family protein [Deltaproteobacteria bacterium TL4]
MPITTFKLETVAIVGLGLIGGSVALDLQRLGLVKRLVGYDQRQDHCQQALEHGLVHYASPQWDAELTQAQLVILSVPVGAFEVVVAQIREYLAPGVILSDVGSVKSPLLALMKKAENQHINFIGAHPIAGSEHYGPTSARIRLFEGRKLIITPDSSSNPEALSLVRTLWEHLGSNVIEMDAESHDEVFAWVSHLPHLLAYASIKTIAAADHPEILSFSGAGLKDFSRIASSSPEMWADIFMENQSYLLAHLAQFEQILTQLKTTIQQRDRDSLVELLFAAKNSRDHWVR